MQFVIPTVLERRKIKETKEETVILKTQKFKIYLLFNLSSGYAEAKYVKFLKNKEEEKEFAVKLAKENKHERSVFLQFITFKTVYCIIDKKEYKIEESSEEDGTIYIFNDLFKEFKLRLIQNSKLPEFVDKLHIRNKQFKKDINKLSKKQPNEWTVFDTSTNSSMRLKNFVKV